MDGSLVTRQSGKRKTRDLTSKTPAVLTFDFRSLPVALSSCLLLCVLLSACRVGPDYKRPPVETPSAYKELPPPNSPQASEWAPAQPNDAVARGKWWQFYNDPELNSLEEQVSISNQNVIAAEAQFREAKFAVKIARSNLYPTFPFPRRL